MIKAVIFDMNGVIVNDEKIHQRSWKIFCKRHNFKVSREEFKTKFLGRIEKEILTYLFKKQLSKKDLEKYVSERVKIAMDLFRPNLAPINGSLPLIKNLYAEKMPLALATAARDLYTNFILEGLNIKKYFKVVTTAEDIFKGKPDPEIYLKTARKLNLNPKVCIVFEDTPAGVKAAKTAGMKVIAIMTTVSRNELSHADIIINSFAKIDIKEIKRL